MSKRVKFLAKAFSRFSFRRKVLLALGVPMLLTLIVCSYLGPSYLLGVKIYDTYDRALNYAQTTAASTQGWMDQIAADSRNLAALSTAGGNASAYFSERTMKLGVMSWGLVKQSGEISAHLGPTPQDFLNAVSVLSWKPENFHGFETLVASLPNGEIAIGVATPFPSGEWAVSVSIAKMPIDLVPASEDVFILVFNSFAGAVYSNAKFPVSPALVNELLKATNKSETGEIAWGVRELPIERTDFVLGYERIKNSPLLVLSFIPRKTAVVAAQNLLWQMLAVSFALLFIALGLGMIIVHQTTAKLRTLWQAMLRVTTGELAPVPADNLSNDEVDAIGLSMNLMLEKIAQSGPRLVNVQTNEPSEYRYAKVAEFSLLALGPAASEALTEFDTVMTDLKKDGVEGVSAQGLVLILGDAMKDAGKLAVGVFDEKTGEIACASTAEFSKNKAA